MRRLSAVFLFTLFLLPLSRLAGAEEVPVPPGFGTLNTAIANASDGDVLLLRNGTYNLSDNLVIDKALTLRALRRIDQPLLESANVTIDAPDKQVTLQGLGFGGTLFLKAGAAVRILENDFFMGHIDGNDYRADQGDGELAIIGNHLFIGSISNIHASDAYIAGNTLDNGNIHGDAPAWVVGNFVRYVATNVNQTAVWFEAASGRVGVIGNRIELAATDNTYWVRSGIQARSPVVFVAGNIVRFEARNGSDYAVGINVDGSAFSRVINNVVDGGGADYPNSTGIFRPRYAAGNIVTGFNRGTPLWLDATAFSVANLCFENGNDSACGAGAVLADPDFVDRDDYQLNAGSPAIDAGPENPPQFSDLDRSRNDIGAHGGPWAIDQYDAQRDPANADRPFVFPLFGFGELLPAGVHAHALGVARLH